MRLKFAAVLPAFLLAVPAVLAQTESAEFTVGDIRIEGLQRITEGTVYNYLPVNIGDRLDNRRVDEALRALYATGFFRDVEIRRDGGTLVVAVLERPSIESFTITGNKDIKTEDLEKSLRNVGLSRGKTFNQSTLDEVERFLTDQYFSRGKYAVQVDTKVEEVAGNRVKIAVDIVEGKRSKIRQINVVGNEAFSDDDLLADFKLQTPNWLSWYKQDDRYSREELSGDIEKLRSYYMDRGYANMDVETTQVAITPEKDDIFITLNVKEGDVYRISDVKIAGNLVVPEEQLKPLVAVRRGDVFSRKMVTATTELMQLRLGQDGYAFAKIDPVPKENPATKEIELTFLVDPGNRAYVRNIGFTGSTGINDDVLRREIRQMEGGYLSNAAIDRSKIRLQRLPFIEKVEVETNPVPGTPDLVDVTYDIKEGLPGQFSGGIGYSESQSILLNGSFVHSNFMGTGNRVAAEINAGQYSKVFSLSHTDPYTTIDGVSRTVSATWRSISQFTTSSSDFETETGTLGLDYAWPLTEFQSVRMGFAAQRSDLFTDPNSSAAEALYWVQNNGNTYTEVQNVGIPPIALTYYGTQVRYVRILARLVVRFAQPRAVRGSRLTPPPERFVRAALQRHRFRELQLRLPAVHPGEQVVHADVQQRGGIRPGARRHDVDAAVPAVLRGRPGNGARLPGKPHGPEGFVRQPLRRQHQVHQPVRTAAADAGKMEEQRAFQPVLRHWQRFLQRRCGVRRPRRRDAGGL